MWTEVDILDPHVIRDASNVIQMRNVYEPLVDISPDGQVEGILATDWSISDDGLVYTFQLRPDVVFSDGTTFDAEAAKFSIERLKDGAKGNAPYVDSVEAVDVLSPNELQITLSEPNALFLRGLWLVWMVSPTAVQDNAGEDFGEAWLNLNTAGTGPYKLDRQDRGSELLLTRHEDYWGGWEGNHFDKVSLRVINEPTTQRLQLENGDLDISLLFTPDMLDAYAGNPDIVVEGGPITDSFFMLIQMDEAASTASKQVRQALNYAWDGDTYAQLMQGQMDLSKGPLSAPLQQSFGLNLENPYSFDLEKASDLLAEAGYPDGEGLTLQLWTHVPDNRKTVMVELFQDTLSQIGVEAEIQEAEWPAIRQTVVDFATSGDETLLKEVLPLSIVARLGDPRELYRTLYHSESTQGAGSNYMNYSNPEVDRLIDESLVTTDDEVARELIEEATAIIAEDAPNVFAASIIGNVPMRAEISGYQHRPIVDQMLRYYELSRTP